MGLFNWVKKPIIEQKKSFNWQMVDALFEKGLSDSFKCDKDFLDHGYLKNPVVFRCIEQIASAGSHIDIEIHSVKNDEKEVITDHPLLTLLKRPNPVTSGKQFLKQAITELKINGCFIQVIKSIKNEPFQLMVLPTEKMTITPGSHPLWPEKYTYMKGSASEKVFPVNQVTGECDVLFLKSYNPSDSLRNLSPMKPCGKAIESFNKGQEFNLSLLKKSGRPSAIIQVDPDVSEESLNRLDEQVKEHWSGSQNAGCIPVIQSAKWENVGISPKDMDFQMGMDKNSMYIASVYGVPFPLLSPDAATFNNYETAIESFYSNTVLPMMNEILESLGNWLLPMYGVEKDLKTTVYLTYNPDNIDALEAKRARKFDRMLKATNVLSINEIRRELGYPDQQETNNNNGVGNQDGT